MDKKEHSPRIGELIPCEDGASDTGKLSKTRFARVTLTMNRVGGSQVKRPLTEKEKQCVKAYWDSVEQAGRQMSSDVENGADPAAAMGQFLGKTLGCPVGEEPLE